MITKQTFESSLLQFASNKDHKQVFQDFLALTLCIFTLNPSKELEMEIYSRYEGIEIKDSFPKILDSLLSEMQEKERNPNGNDVLGEFCQKYYYTGVEDKQILSWKECVKTSINAIPPQKIISESRSVEFLDVGCRSGRIMIASTQKNNNKIVFHGVEYDWIYIMIASLNLFFNNCQHAEILWVDQLNNNSFKESYFISPFPSGIVRNNKKENSKTWNLYQSYLKTKQMVRSKL